MDTSLRLRLQLPIRDPALLRGCYFVHTSRRLHLLSLAVALAVGGCASEIVPITTYQGFCDAVHSPPDPDASSSKARYFAPDSIRREFVARYDSAIVAAVAYWGLGEAQPTDTVVRELRRLQMVGAWSDGSQLHVANFSWADSSDVVATSFESMVAEFRRLLSLDPEPRMEATQRCFFSAINAFFSSLTVHGAPPLAVTIPTAYYLRSHEQYDAVAASRARRQAR